MSTDRAEGGASGSPSEMRTPPSTDLGFSDNLSGSGEGVIMELRARVRERARAAAAAELAPKRPAESAITLSRIITLADVNALGDAHGGEIMKLIDTAAGIAASRHASGPAVTASLDEMSFLHPVHVGNVVLVHASVNDAGRTSIEVGVRVEAEDVITGSRTHTSSAYLVFVAVDENERPRPVPPLVPETSEERRRQAEAKIRRASRRGAMPSD